MRVGSSTPRRESPRPEAGSGAAFRAVLGERTPLRAGAALGAIGNAYREVCGVPASPSALALLAAQWAHETDGGRAMYGNNFGGIRATRGGVALTTREGSGAEAVRSVGRFRTYETAQLGATDYLRLLATRYPAALAAAASGSVERFVGSLAQGGYFTADPREYLRGLRFRLASLDPGSTSFAAAATVPFAADRSTASGRPIAPAEAVLRALLAPILHWLSRALYSD